MPLHYLIKDEATEETIERILLRAIQLAEKKSAGMFLLQSRTYCKENGNAGDYLF